ncbi:hypothetical protein VQW71_05630, partial [Helicobacter pylori]|uniref:hypothetical protein n=1 Tax=Helicobacter pylori TaxID=210 RepID=UPI003567D3BF
SHTPHFLQRYNKIKIKAKIKKKIRFFAWLVLIKNNINDTLIIIEKSETIFKPFLNTIRAFYF